LIFILSDGIITVTDLAVSCLYNIQYIRSISKGNNLSREKVERIAAELARVQSQYQALETEVLRANEIADKSGKDVDREYAVKRTNSLLALLETKDQLEGEVTEAQREFEEEPEEPEESTEEDNRNFNKGYLRGSFVALGLLGSIFLVIGLAKLVEWLY